MRWHWFVQPPVQWNGGVGYISKGMLEANCPPPADDVQVIHVTHPPTSNGYCDIVS
jgi:cytochrome-b5 reductase